MAANAEVSVGLKPPKAKGFSGAGAVDTEQQAKAAVEILVIKMVGAAVRGCCCCRCHCHRCCAGAAVAVAAAAAAVHMPAGGAVGSIN